ncbi:MAG: carboxylate-amine ligase [Alphaproteobacteria bacterium]|jgi:carboxylate-amine ligase|nr:carboxylate-amine ligase [Alphaproteobacteria bacterium]MDP6515245.1 carboxylate-amine ligase [Alphaproteobacteria bacterium]
MAREAGPDRPPFTLGVEEEYLLIDPDTRDLVRDPPPDLIADCGAGPAGQVMPEFLQAQIEIGTTVCKTVAEVRADLAALRRTVVTAAAQHGLRVIAASTHPFASWHQQRHTRRERYDRINIEYQATARRLLVCGMHVHVGIDDDALRIDLMNQFSYFLPHLLALSTSSPFWEAEDTGLKSYRITVFDALPRSGLPPTLASWHEHQRLIAQLVGAGAIEDGTKLWWDMRPSARFPTLEMRVTDVCTRLDDAVTIAALVQSVTHMLWRLRTENRQFRIYPPVLVAENRWRAMRYGIDEGLIDFGAGVVKPMAVLIDELIAMISTDAEALGCRAEVERARAIVGAGTSAHRQLAAWRAARAAGADNREALDSVVDMLIAETTVGIDPPPDHG